MFKKKVEEVTLFLNQTLAEYEVIPANFGWHIHSKDQYCGHLEYQETIGWQGNALNSLPQTVRTKLQKGIAKFR